MSAQFMTRFDIDANGLASLVQRVLAGSNQTVATSETLPPAVYTSQAFFDLEVEKIFKKEWLCVGHVSQVANVGDYFAVDLFGEPLVVVRGKDRVRVMSRVCLHRWAPIVSGAGNTKVFSCPFHKWGYGLDGQLLGVPFMDKAAEFDPKECRLPEIRSEIVEDLGFIFVTFSDTAESISERLEDLCVRLKNWQVNELVAVEPSELDAAFNWKIQIETGMECLHHFAAHPETFEVNFPTRLSWCEDSKRGWTICHSPARPEAPEEVHTIGLPVQFRFLSHFPPHPPRRECRSHHVPAFDPNRPAANLVEDGLPGAARSGGADGIARGEVRGVSGLCGKGGSRGLRHQPHAAGRRRLDLGQSRPAEPSRSDGVAARRICSAADRRELIARRRSAGFQRPVDGFTGVSGAI